MHYNLSSTVKKESSGKKSLNWMDARQPSDSWVSTNQKVNLSNDFATFLVLPYNWKFRLSIFLDMSK